ncbi:MAG: carbohydrate porin [Sphingobium sp.]
MMARAHLCLLAPVALLAPLPATAQEGGAEPAVELSLGYTADVAATVAGGSDHKVRYLDNFDVVADADLDRLAGWRGARAHVYVLSNFGRRPNDSAGTLEGVDNIEVGKQAVRLFEAWVEQDLGGDASVLAGLYDLNSEFYANDAAGLLISPQFGIGSEFSATGPNGPSIFPSAALSLRFRTGFDDGNGYFQAAALNARAQTWGDTGGIDASFADGVLLIGEAGRMMGPARLSLGAWTYSKKQDDVFETDGLGDPIRRAAWGVYGLAEARLVGGDDEPHIDAFVRGGVSDGHTSDFSGAFSVGVHMVRTSASFRERTRADGDNPSRHEYGIELTYSDRVAPFLLVQPDLQIIGNPSGLSDAPTVVVTTLRVTVEIPTLGF